MAQIDGTDSVKRRLELLSIVIPCFNEEQCLETLYRTLCEMAEKLPEGGIEMVFVDDGSRDATPRLLRDLQLRDPRVRVVYLSRNFGHQVAVTAGLEHAIGNAVVVIDADLQDPPDVILTMVERWKDGVDVVYGVRRERNGETRWKLFTAMVFYRVINLMSDVEIPLDAGDFRLMDRRVVDAMRDMPERDRFVRGMVAWSGFWQEPVHYTRAPRFGGETKYPLRKMVSFAADGILSFSIVPLRLAIYVGLLASMLAILGIIYALALRLFTDIWVTGWTFQLIANLFLGGVQLMFLGVIGEYVGRIYGEVKRRPLYIVRERLGFESKPRMRAVSGYSDDG